MLITAFSFAQSNTSGVSTMVYHCSMCSGSGRCFTCGGRGQIFGVWGASICPICLGSRICKMCNGSGTIVSIVDTKTGVGTVNGQVIVVDPVQKGNSQGAIGSSPNKTGSKTSIKECSVCRGTGKELTRREAPGYGSPKKQEYCAICNGIYRAHYHNPCKLCKGTGQIK